MIPDPSPRALLATGVVGSALAVVGGFWVAATPLAFRVDPPPVIDRLPPQAPVASVAWFLGVALLSLAWLGFGRRLWRGDDLDWRTLRNAGLAAAAPMLLAVPLSSRDLWAYASQARITAAGLNPYLVSPAEFVDSSTANVSAKWVESVSPYGPLWTLIGRGLEAVTGSHDLASVMVLRLPAAAGFLLLAFVVPPLARRVGASRSTACWLVLANPMVVLHGVGGGHNDTLMVGLMAAGLLVVVSAGPRWRVLLLAGVLVGAGAAIKIPALVAVPFLPLIWMRYAPGAPPWAPMGWRAAVRLRAREVAGGLAWALGGAVAVLAATSAAAGFGVAWLGAANTEQHGGGPLLVAALLVVLVVLWLLAIRGRQWQLLAAALTAPALTSVSSLAWYWFWPLVPAALFLRGRLATFVVAVVSISEVLNVRPNGQDSSLRPEFMVAIATVVAWIVLDRHWRPFSERTEARPVEASAPRR